MAKSLILGLDPGLKGGVAVFDMDLGLLVFALPLPMAKMQKGDKAELDPNYLANLLSPYAKHIHYALVEQPAGIPNQSSTSTFRFGYGCGQVHGVLGALSIPILFVRPAVWKSALNLSSDKMASLKLASKLYPHHSHLWPNKNHDGPAEAALLIHFAITKLSPHVDKFAPPTLF